jgi:acetyl/propionyl-CoA carboxylase alpha subunit
LGKLIVHAPTREHAVARMRFALDETVILGLGTNQSYLRALAADPNVIAGKVHTGYLGTAYADFAPTPDAEALALITGARMKGLGKSGTGAGVAGTSGTPTYPSPWTTGGAP